jgi:proline dehydrogenase
MLFFVKFWIAGETIDDCIQRTQTRIGKGIRPIINFLGKHSRKKSCIELTVNQYLDLISAIQEKSISSDISVKPSQLGLDIDFNYCYSNMKKILIHTQKNNIFTWIDMEDSSYTERTLQLFYRLIQEFTLLGITIQANLKRSEEDLEELTKVKAKIRLVKGAYRESSLISHISKRAIKDTYIRLMLKLFNERNRFAVATHDKELIDKAIEIIDSNCDVIIFQMLLGIGEKIKTSLIKSGFLVGEYIPYGKNWFPYFVRRFKERKGNILLLVKSIVNV